MFFLKDKKLVEHLVTLGGIGKIKFAPGTFGSLYGILTAVFFDYFLRYIFAEYFSMFHSYINIFFIEIFLLLLPMTYYSTQAIDLYQSETETHDAKEIVIDELIGVSLVYFSCIYVKYNFFGINYIGVLEVILMFILFRIFDILKPWPICYIDKNIKAGFGVILDDVLAAIFAIIIYVSICFIYYSLN